MTFREVLLRRGISIIHTHNPNEIKICCPFCVDRGETPDERFRLGVNTSNGKAHCFNCQWSRSSGAFAAILRRFSVLTLDFEVEPEDIGSSKDEEESKVELPDDFHSLTSGKKTDLQKDAYRYVRRRGITRDQIECANIGVSLVGRYAYRVVFPVMARSELTGLVARDFTGMQEPKYLNSVGKKSIYNMRYNAKRIVLSEGVFKALRIEQIVDREWTSAALLGKSITEEQVKQICKKFKEVVIWPDPDLPGRKGAVEVAEFLANAGAHVGVVWPVSQPADEEDFLSMERRWESSVVGYSWTLRQQMILGSSRGAA